MVSLLADIAICAAILAGAYFWLGARNSAGSGISSGSKKKKNKNKNKAKNVLNAEANVVPEKKQERPQQQPPKQPSLEKEKPAAVQPVQQEKPFIQNGTNHKTKQQPTKSRHTQGQAWRANEEFPPLSAAVKQLQPQKPLAERLAKPTPKTAVDDMLDREVEPEKTFSRTMRIVKPAPSPPLLIDEPGEDEERDADPFGERDSRVEKEAAWESVPITSQKKPPTIRIGISPASSGTSTPARSIPGLTEQSKKQRQNAAKAAAAKAAKDAAEQDRLQRLAAHKRQLERERMNSQAKEREKTKMKSNRETLSGGMTAKVAENGALIWD